MEYLDIMKQHIEIIDGQEVTVKVYAPRPLSKKQTVCLPGTRRRAIAQNRNKKRKTPNHGK